MGKLVGNDTVRVDFEDGCWYLLRRELGWYDSKASGIDDVMRMMVKSSAFEQGEAGENDLVEVKMTMAERDLGRLRARLAGWSHGEKLTDHNIKRIPLAHAEQLLAEIDGLEKTQQSQELDTETKNE